MARGPGWWVNRPEAIIKVKKMLEEGLSARRVGEILTRELGIFISRNAIIGLNSRERLVPKKVVKARPRPRRPQTDQRITPKLKAAANSDVEPREIEFNPHQDAARGFGDRLKSILELEPGDCKWPVGNPRKEGFGFCGVEAKSGPYCQDHTRVAFPRR